MTQYTYFIQYTPNTQANSTNAIHVFLKQRNEIIYLEQHSWFIVTNQLASDIRDSLLPMINADDALLIFTVGPDWSVWGLEDDIKNWLKNNWHPGLPIAR